MRGNNNNLKSNQVWYVSGTNEMICQKCFMSHIKNKAGYTTAYPGQPKCMCECQKPKEEGEYKIHIISDDDKIYENINGIVNLPSHTRYFIHIEGQGYFKIEHCSVGNREVEQAKGIYIMNQITLSGFKPHTRDCFFFTASKPPSFESENASIVLLIQEYKRINTEDETIPRNINRIHDEYTISRANPITRYVRSIPTHGTIENFVKVGEPKEIRIQIMTQEPDNVIELKFEKEKRRMEHEKEYKQKRLKRLKKDLSNLDKKLKKF